MGDNAATGFRAWLPLIIVSGAVLTAALDHTVVVTVLPEVMPDLKVPPTELDRAAWIITGYLLGFTAAIPLTARLADVHGHALLFRVSLLVFALGSLGAAMAPNLELLIAARVVQALGGGATIPVGMAMAVHAFPGTRRAIAVGIIGACAEAGMVLGPLYGGVITNLWGWRWVFWLDIPQALILIWALRGFPVAGLPGVRMDWAGGALMVLGLTMLVIATAQETAFDAASPWPYALGGAGAIVVGLLVWVESRAPYPLLPPSFFQSRQALLALVVKLLMGAALIMAMVTVPLMANTVLAQSPLEGGLRLMRMTGAMPLGAIVGGFLAYRLGERAVTVAGLAIGSVGLFYMSGWAIDIADPRMSLHLALAGFGFGLVIAPVFVTAMDATTADYQATSASLVTTARMIGMTFGMAALAAWGVGEFEAATQGLALPLPSPDLSNAEYEAQLEVYTSSVSDASIDLFQDFFRISGVLLLAALLPALGLGGKRTTEDRESRSASGPSA
ncbi:MAG: MFS transporter [Chloroflexota bacterium]|nr:MFS transporter [Chloroflexota bacterium]